MQDKSLLYRLLWLFKANVIISCLAVGGGYVVIPLIKKQFIDDKKAFSFDTLMEMAAVAQSTPGAIAINLAALTGYKIAGLTGAVVATFSCVISGFVISLISYGFFCRHRDSRLIMAILQGLKAVATGLIGSAGAGILLLALTGHNQLSGSIAQFDFWALLIAVFSIILLRKFKMNPVWVLGLSATAGIAIY